MHIASCLYVASYLVVGFAHARRPDFSSAEKHTATKRDHSSDIWCGLVTSAESVNVVEGTWTVPSISLPRGADAEKEYWSYQWVGIDGNNKDCQVLLQGGTGQTIIDGEINTFACYIENVTTGEKKSFEATSKNGPLCQGAAEWIQEYPDVPYA
ncbi:hypothetical protein PWT90_01146 [Aphanocladium album]|nr:hypothetical protein PWT90_01146 [Aphanocladium album]